MTEPTAKPSFRWSFSQWETYNQCPQKWKFANVLKYPRKPPGPAAARGLEIHDSIEQYIKSDGNTAILHPAVNPKYVEVFDAFRLHPNGDRYTEKRLGFDNEWYTCLPTAPNTAVIAVLDAARFEKQTMNNTGVVHIGEWKSGKPKDTHADQRKLYAMFGLRVWLADEVHVTTYYVEDTAPPARLTVRGEGGFTKLRDMWNMRIYTMQRDEICAPRPTFACRFCDFAKSQGGPCQFGR